VAACPKLTELTIIYPRPGDDTISEKGIIPDGTATARAATSEIVNACTSLPDFDTLQIVHSPLVPPLPRCGCGRMRVTSQAPSTKQQKEELRAEVKALKDLAIDCLREPRTGCLGRKTTVRVLELKSDRPRPRFHLGAVEVEEYEV